MDMRQAFRTVLLLAWVAVVPHSVHAQEGAGIQVAVITNAGGAHLGAYFNGLAQTAEVNSVVLVDPDGKWEAVARKALGDTLTGVYTDWDAMLATEQPAMALVTMEAALAPEAIGVALDAGCHVLAEKPACVNAGEFAVLVEKAEAKERHLMLALANRLNPEILKARELIADGALGRIYGLQMNLIDDQTRLRSPAYHASWFADKARAGGGHLTWLDIHWLDLAMYVTGSPITGVAGFVGNVGGQPINIEDAVALSLRFENGSLGTLSGGYFLDPGSETMLKFWGSKGWLEIESEVPRRVRWVSTLDNDPAVHVFDGSDDYVAYTAFVRACVRASAGLEAPPITGRESLRALKVVYGAYDAAAQGKTVDLE